jgi:hypothetical protein
MTGLALLSATLSSSASDRQTIHRIKLNPVAFEFAKTLIEQDHFVADKRNDWHERQPSSVDENEFIRAHGIAEYAKWYLGIDEHHGEKSKARYKFPFGDFKNVHRSAFLAIRSRARQYGYTDIESAAAELQRRLEQKRN